MKVKPLAPVVPEHFNRSCDIEKVLMDLVPQDIVKEQVRASLAKDALEIKDEVMFPKDEADKVMEDLQNDQSVTVTDKSKMIEEFKGLFEAAGKTFGQIEAENPTSEDEIDEISNDVKECLVLAWREILIHCAKETAQNDSGRLDDNLLPTMSPSVFFTDSNRTFWDFLTDRVEQQVYPENVKAIHLAFKDKVKEAVDQRPDGLEFSIDLFIKKDANGYFITSKT